MQIDMQVERLQVLPESRRAEPVAQASPAHKAGRSDSKVTPLEVAKIREREEAKPTDKDVQEAVQRLSDYVQNAQRDLLFSVDKETGRTVIQVLDSETKEVVRQIPPEEILALARRMQEPTEETGGLLQLRV